MSYSPWDYKESDMTEQVCMRTSIKLLIKTKINQILKKSVLKVAFSSSE